MQMIGVGTAETDEPTALARARRSRQGRSL